MRWRRLVLIALTAAAVVYPESGFAPALAVAPSAASTSPVITTVAGGVGQGPATSISQHPTAVAAHGSRLVVLETPTTLPPLGVPGIGIIRSVDLATGRETFVGGNDRTSGFAGDGGPATTAKFGGPRAVALDATGNIYLADTGNNRVRKIDTAGIITTIAGTGDEADAGDGGPATSASLSPKWVAVAPGPVVFAASNSGVRQIAANGIISTVSGVPSGPIATDLDGNLYVATGSTILRRTTSGTVTVVAGTGTAGHSGDGGPATSAQISASYLTVYGSAPATISFIEDAGYVRQVSPAGVISTIAGNGTAGFAGDGGPSTGAVFNFGTSTLLYGRPGIAADGAGNLHVADHGNFRVRRLSVAGTASTVAGNGLEGFGSSGFGGDGGPAQDAQLRLPVSTAALPGGGYVIADAGNHRIRRVATDGTISTIAGSGATSSTGDGGPAVAAGFTDIKALTVDGAGNIYVADGARVRRIGLDGVITTVAGNGSSTYGGDGGPATSAGMVPQGLTVGPDARLYISDGSNGTVRVVHNGVISRFAGDGIVGSEPTFGSGKPRLEAHFTDPRDLFFDGKGSLYVLDAMASGLRRISPLGSVRRVASAGGQARGAAMDASGRVYFSRGDAPIVVRYEPSVGCCVNQTTVAGSLSGFSGDGGPATSARLEEVRGVSISGHRMLVSDGGNNRVRALDLVPLPLVQAEPGAAVLVDGWGGLHRMRVGQYAPPAPVNGPYWTGWDIVRGVSLASNGLGGYVLDGWGGLHRFHYDGGVDPPALANTPYWSGWDIARGLSIVENGGYVLDGWGGLHPIGVVSRSQGGPYWTGWDIARGVAFLPDRSGGYVLDGWGGLHPFSNGAGPLPPPVQGGPYWTGWDIARGVMLLPDGTGGYVIDGWGGTHPFSVGNRPLPPPTVGGPYWTGWDIARGGSIQE